MLTGVHFLLTYSCPFECDHCFLYCSPNSEGTFTVGQLRSLFDEIARMPDVHEVFFEGGEPFLYYPIMLEGIRMAKAQGLWVGIVTNCYWATTEEDARVWLTPLKELEVDSLSLSNDQFHASDPDDNSAVRASHAAKELGINIGTICIEPPRVSSSLRGDSKGEPVVGGDVRFRGRAADKLTVGLPTKPLSSFVSCDDEELRDPKRVHVDPQGNVQVCQGLSIGNLWDQPLSQMMAEYDPDNHPICGPLLRGGPKALAKETGEDLRGEYVDACHACFEIRRALVDKYPGTLTPKQVYGISD